MAVAGPAVRTTGGLLTGISGEGYERYLGIPYAAPPIGRRRFAAPEPAEPWAGTFAAEEFGPHAPQLASVMEQFFRRGADPVTDEAGCLTLNVWTPCAGDGGRPVMVWIHGGAFTMGSSNTPWYDGARFAVDHDVVVVSLNYRLGVLGFTYLGEVGGPELIGSGSLGIQDAAAALRWVRDNIAAFGGDPGNVTIFGESAGAMSVGTLLALPQAQGLFHKAILQSGAASHVFRTDEAAELTAELLSILGIGTASPVEQLRDLPVARLLEGYQTLATKHARAGLVSKPVVDGEVLDRPPLEAVTAGAAAGIPMIIGTNLDEWRLFSIADPSTPSTDEGRLAAVVAGLGVAEPESLIGAYRRRLAEATPADVLNAVMADSTFRIPAIRLAEAQTAAGGRAWMYLFTWPSPQFGGALGACHAIELPYVFNTLDREGSAFFVGDDPPEGLARDLNATWAAFARHGDPGRGTLGPWPAYDGQDRQTMVVDTSYRVDLDPMGDERAAWAGL